MIFAPTDPKDAKTFFLVGLKWILHMVGGTRHTWWSGTGEESVFRDCEQSEIDTIILLESFTYEVDEIYSYRHSNV